MSLSSIPFKQIKLVVFDIDGTLYPQFPVRRKMVFQLLSHSLKNLSFKTAHIIRDYRKLREEFGEREESQFKEKIKAEICKKYALSEPEYEFLIFEWFLKKPLPWLLKIRFPHVAEVFSFLKAQKIKLAVLSDYPAKEKLQTLRLEADYAHWAGDPEIESLKPNPKGLMHIMEKAGVSPKETLMIGDRMDRDGEIAQRAGTYFLLRGNPEKNPNAPACFAHWGDLLKTLQTLFKG